MLHSGVGSSLSSDVMTEGARAVHAIFVSNVEKISPPHRGFTHGKLENLSNEETCPSARALGASAFQNRKYS